MAELLKSIKLENGLQVNFFDTSNRYFGDFHRVCIEVKAEISLEKFNLAKEQQAGRELSGPLCFKNKLKRMGVPTADLDRVKQAMMEDFLQTTGKYLSRPNFPRQFLKAKLAEKPKSKFLLRR